MAGGSIALAQHVAKKNRSIKEIYKPKPKSLVAKEVKYIYESYILPVVELVDISLSA